MADVGALLGELSKKVLFVALPPEKEKRVRELAAELGTLLDAKTVIAH
jgi:hypothetical protein